MSKFLLAILIILTSIAIYTIKPPLKYEIAKAEEQKDSKLRFTLFEEFPNDDNLSKLVLFDFPVNIFIAARSIEEFNQTKTRVEKYPNIKTVGYWPVLAKEEGYWISALSKREGIERVIKELKNVKHPISVLWDAELPYLRKALFVTELPRFFDNRKLIYDFIAHPPSNVTLYVAENRDRGLLYRLVLEIFAATFDPEIKYNRVEMLYGQITSDTLKEVLSDSFKNQNYYPAFGITAYGIGDMNKENRIIVTPEKLDEELSIASSLGIKEVFIYRLGGINREYLELIRKHAKP